MNEYKILVHSKNLDLLQAIEGLSKGTSYRIVRLTDITDLALSVYDEMPYLVLADLSRANVGGFEICKQLKSDAVLEHIPLVVLTDLTEGSELPDCGADRYLSREDAAEAVWAELRDLVESCAHALDVHPLTRLPGSRSSVERIESMLEKGDPFAICAIQLRNLNYYYRTFGPKRGDALVRRTMEVLLEVYSGFSVGRGFVGHFGDPHFVTALSPDRAIEFAERMIEQFETRLSGTSGVGGGCRTEGVVTLSLAIVTNEKLSFTHISEVVRTLEQMHRFLRRYPHSAFLKDRRSHARDLMSSASFEIGSKPLVRPPVNVVKNRHQPSGILSAVTAAIHSGQMEACYQPIVDWSGNVLAYEALTHFPTSDGNIIDAARVFQGAREADLIRELDVACAVNLLRCAKDLSGNSKLFVNLNRETLLDHRCLEEMWDDGYFDTRRIVIEITEQSLLKQSAKLRACMGELAARGIGLALDDAGGGAVSLREAAELRPQYIKFDKSIIRDIHVSAAKQRIVLSLSVFAKSMNALTVAEGIETEAEWNYLKTSGVDLGQGFFIAKPQVSPIQRAIHLP